MGSTLLSKFACLGSHQPSFFGVSAWIPPQNNGEQVCTEYSNGEQEKRE